MAILERVQLRAAVHAIREVRLAVEPERLESTEQFYRDVLGLRRWPPRHAVPGGIGLGNPRVGLLLQFRHDLSRNVGRRQCTVLVSDLDEAQRRLQGAGVAFERVNGFFLSDDRILTTDPAGNRVEVRPSRSL